MKTLSTLVKSKWLIAGTFVALLLLIDGTLILADQWIGAEKGVMFGYSMKSLLITVDALLLSALAVVYLIIFLMSRLKVIREIVINIGVSLIALLIAVMVIELIFYLILQTNNSPAPYAYDYHDGSLFRRDSLLGFALNKNTIARYSKIYIDPIKGDSSAIFDTVIHTDSLANRSIDIPGMDKRSQYALFFGCSFTFGLGVEDAETLPHRFAQKNPDYCAYNFAVTGYGPQSTLAKLQYQRIRESVKQDSGICFYVYMQDHPERAIGSMRISTSFGKNLPYYDYEDDTLRYYGLFSRNRLFVSGAYWLMSKSNVLKYFKVTFPSHIRDKDYKLSCDIMYQSYQEYKKQFNNDNFYVVVYPSGEDILPYLKKYDLRLLDFSELFKGDGSKYFIPFDGHPTAFAHETLATELTRLFSHEHVAADSMWSRTAFVNDDKKQIPEKLP